MKKGILIPNGLFISAVEMGAELVHGKATSVAKVAEEFKLKSTEVFSWAHGSTALSAY